MSLEQLRQAEQGAEAFSLVAEQYARMADERAHFAQECERLKAALTDCICAMGFADSTREPGKGIWAARERAKLAIDFKP